MAEITQIDVGTLPHQVPTNGDLGDLAFMDKSAFDAFNIIRQTNKYDTTPGAVLEVGSFGVGGSAVLSTDLNSIKVSCVVQVSGADPNKPPTGTFVETITANGLYFQRSVSATSTRTQYTRYGFDVAGTPTYTAWTAINDNPSGTNIGNTVTVGAFGIGYGGKNAPLPVYAGNIDTVTGANAVPFGLIYYSSNSTLGTGPYANSYGTIVTHYGVVQSTNVTCRQMFYETLNLAETGRIYYRSMWGTTWGPWIKMLTSQDMDTGWLTPTFSNAWAQYPNYPAGYRKSLGAVELRGLVQNPNSVPQTPIYTLPVGYRPTQNIVATGMASTAAAMVAVYIGINTSGVVSVNAYAAGGASGAVAWLSLDNIRIPLN